MLYGSNNDDEVIDFALENFNKAIKVKPDYFQAYINRGNVLLKLKEIVSALESYDQAIKIAENTEIFEKGVY